MSGERKTTNWTPEMLERIKKVYEQEKASGRDGTATLTFDGNEFTMKFVKYLIEYLEDKFGGRK